MINIATFILISSVYVTSLAIVDGLFNRLIFGNNKKLPYSSEIKKEIYKKWEWGFIGLIFLILLPVVIPVLTSYLIGGAVYALIYLIVLLIIPWDIIFGKLVFDDYLGDTPSISLPIVGWINIPLILVYIVRLLLLIIAIVSLLNLIK